MATITVPFQVLNKGYEMTGDYRSGLTAVVPYFMSWANAFTFVEEAFVAPTANRIGAITWISPLQFPVPIGGTLASLYADSFRMVPAGASGTPIPTDGLAPGEYFTNAIVFVTFKTPPMVQGFPQDDPQNLQQLDPNNPITACEQSVKITGKVTMRKGSAWRYGADAMALQGKPVPGDVPVIQNEVRLVLKFPRVPYLPWQAVQPYVGKINIVTVLTAVKGALLLEGMETDVTAMTDGSIGQKAVLNFAFNPDPTGANPQGMDWNNFPLPDGSGYASIKSADGSGKQPYIYVDFSAIFAALQF